MRETRHLWVGNLPDNAREDKIAECFKRFGKIEKVKLLLGKQAGSASGACIAFVDIRSALKAMNSQNFLSENLLKTDFFDPSSATKSLPPSGEAAKSTSMPNAKKTMLPKPHVESATASVEETVVEQTRADPGNAVVHNEEIKDAPNIPDNIRNKKKKDATISSKKKLKKSLSDSSKIKKVKEKSSDRGRSPNAKMNKKNTNEPPNDKGQGLSEEDYTASSRSGSSRSSSRSGRSSSSSSNGSTSSTGSTNSSGSISSNGTVEGSQKKAVAMCIRKLPVRPTVSSLRDGIFHEFKKYGKVKSVLIKGDGPDRHALVVFRNNADANKAISHAKTKLLFGAAIEASMYEGEVSGQELEECGGIIDEFHPRASRTLFVGNLDKTVGYSDIQNIFVRFGHIVAIEIKKQNSIPQYAFLQYTDIASVVRAISQMDGEKLGRNNLKLGFGKTVISSCLWVAGVTDSFTENYLASCFQRYGSVKHVVIDRNRGMALVFYTQFEDAQIALSKMKARKLNRSRLKIDYASNELIDLFIKSMQKSGQSIPNLENIRHLLLANSPSSGIPSGPSSSSQPPLPPTPGHHYSRGPQQPDSGRSYYDEYPHQSYADSPSGSYSESSSRRGSYRPWQGRERGRDRYGNGYPPDHPMHGSRHVRRPYDDPPYDRPERDYYRNPDHPSGWDYDNYSESRSKGHPPHFDQDYRHQDYDARRDRERLYGRPVGAPGYDDPYYKRERGRELERSKDRVRDRDRDPYYSRSSHASPAMRHMQQSRSQSPHSNGSGKREGDRVSQERGFGEGESHRKSARSPETHTTRTRKHSGESRSSTSSTNKLPTQDVDMRETSLTRRVDYRDKRSKSNKSQRSPDASRSKKHADVDLRSSKDNENEGSPYYRHYPRSRSETPTRDENLDSIGEVIIKQQPTAGKPHKREYSRREDISGDKDYRQTYSPVPKDYHESKHSPDVSKKASRSFTKDLDYRKSLTKSRSGNSPVRKKESYLEAGHHSRHERLKHKESNSSKHSRTPDSMEADDQRIENEPKKSTKKRRLSIEENDYYKKKDRKLLDEKIHVKHEAPMSVAQQIFMQEEDEDTKSPELPCTSETKKVEEKEEKKTSAVSSLDVDGYNAMFLPNKKLLPVKTGIVPPKTQTIDVPSQKKIVADVKTELLKMEAPVKSDTSVEHLLQLEKEKLRLQKLLSKLDSDSLDKEDAGEIARVFKESKAKQLKKVALAKKIPSTEVVPDVKVSLKDETEQMETESSMMNASQEEIKEFEEIIEDTYEVEVDVTPEESPVKQPAKSLNISKPEDETEPQEVIETTEVTEEVEKLDEIVEEQISEEEVVKTSDADTIPSPEQIPVKTEVINTENVKSESFPCAKDAGFPVKEEAEKVDESSVLKIKDVVDKAIVKLEQPTNSESNSQKFSSASSTPVVSTSGSSKPSVSTATPSPLSSSSAGSSKSHHKVPYSVPHKPSSSSDPHHAAWKMQQKRNLVSPGSKHQHDHHRLKHQHDTKKRKPSSSQQYKKQVSHMNKKPHSKHVPECTEKIITRITVGLDLSPNKPLSKKELDRLRFELEGLKRQLTMDPVEMTSPNDGEDEFSVAAASPILRSPIDSKDGVLNKSNFMIPSVSSTDRLKFGRIKKKAKAGDANANSTEFQKKIKQELHDQRAFDFRESRLLRSSIFEQDLERLEASKQQLEQEQVKEMLQCWRVNGTSEANLLFSGSRFLEPLPEHITNGNGHSFPILNPQSVGNHQSESSKLSNSTGPKNVYPLSISELPASAESEVTNIAGKTTTCDANNSTFEEGVGDISEHDNCNTSISDTVQSEVSTSVNSVEPLLLEEKDKILQIEDLKVIEDDVIQVDTHGMENEEVFSEGKSTQEEREHANVSDNKPEISSQESSESMKLSEAENENKLDDFKEDLALSSEEEHLMEVDDMMESAGEVLIESAEQILEADEEDSESKVDSSLPSTIEDSSGLQQYEESISDEPFMEEVVIPCEEPTLHPNSKKDDILESTQEEEDECKELETVEESSTDVLESTNLQESLPDVKVKDEDVKSSVVEEIQPVVVETTEKEVINLPESVKEEAKLKIEEKSDAPTKVLNKMDHVIPSESTSQKSNDKLKDEKKIKIQKESKNENKDIVKSNKKDKEKKKKKKIDPTKSTKSSHDLKMKSKDSSDKKLLKSKKDKHKSESKSIKLVKEEASSKETQKGSFKEKCSSQSKTADGNVETKSLLCKHSDAKASAKTNTNSEGKLNAKVSDPKSSTGSLKLKKKKRKHDSDKQKTSSKMEKDSAKTQKPLKSEKEGENDKHDVKSTSDETVKKHPMKKGEKSKVFSTKSEASLSKIGKETKHKELKISKSHKISKKNKMDSPSKSDPSKKSKSKHFVKSSLSEPESKKMKLSNNSEIMNKEHKKSKKPMTTNQEKRSRYALIYSDSESDSEKSEDEVIQPTVKLPPAEEPKKKNLWESEKENVKESASSTPKKKSVHLSLSTSSSSSNSSEFADGPPPVPPSSMVMTETLKNETILPTDYVKSECLSSARLKESSPEHDSSSAKDSDSKKKMQKTHAKKDDAVTTKPRLISSSSEFSDSDNESGSLSLKDIPLKKNPEKIKPKQSFKQSLKSALFSSSSGDGSDSSDDLSEIPLRSSPKKLTSSQKSSSKSVHKKVVKATTESSKLKQQSKLNSTQSLENKSKMVEHKEKVKHKDKHAKVSKSISDIHSTKTSKVDGKPSLEKKKKHKHHQREHSKDKKESSSNSKKDSKTLTDKYPLKSETETVSKHSTASKPQSMKEKESALSSKHEKSSSLKEGHAISKKHRSDQERSHAKIKSKSSSATKPSHGHQEPSVEKADKKLKSSLIPGKYEERKASKKKHQNPFLQHLKESKKEQAAKPPTKQPLVNETAKKLEKPKSMFSSDSEEEKEVYKKKAAKPFEGWKNLETMIKLKDESSKPSKEQQETNKSSFATFRKTSDYFGPKSLPQDKSNETKEELEEDHTEENHESPKVGKLSIVESPDPVVERKTHNTVKREVPVHRERPTLAKMKDKSPVRSQDEEAVLSIVGLNEDFKQTEEKDDMFPKYNESKPQKKEKTQPKPKVKTEVKPTKVKPDVDESISAADRELAAAVSSIEFGFGDFQRSKTPTLENFPTAFPSADSSSFPSTEGKKEVPPTDLASTAETSLTEEEQQDLSQEDEAARAANALLKFSADEDSSFEFPSVKIPSPKQEKNTPQAQKPVVQNVDVMSIALTKNQSQKHKPLPEKGAAKSDEATPSLSRKRRRLSKDDFTSKPSSGELIVPQEPKQPRVENLPDVPQKAEQPTQSPARTATWQPFITSPKYSPTLPTHPVMQPHAMRKISQEHKNPEIATARRTSSDLEQSGFAHPKVPNIARRKSSTSPNVSPTAGRPFPSYDLSQDKSTKQQPSPGMNTSIPNTPPLMRHDGSGVSVVVSPSQQHFPAQMPYPPRSSLSPKTTAAVPYPSPTSVQKTPLIMQHTAVTTSANIPCQMQPPSNLMNRNVQELHPHPASSQVASSVQSTTVPFSSHAMAAGYPYMTMPQYAARPSHHIGVPTYPGGISYPLNPAATSPKQTIPAQSHGQPITQPHISPQHPTVLMQQQKPSQQQPAQSQRFPQSTVPHQQHVAHSPLVHQQQRVPQSPAAHQQRIPQSPGPHPQRVAQSPSAHQQRVVQSPGDHPQRVVQSPGAHQQRVAQSPGSHLRVPQTPTQQQIVSQSPGHQPRVAPSPVTQHRVGPSPGSHQRVAPSPGSQQRVVSSIPSQQRPSPVVHQQRAPVTNPTPHQALPAHQNQPKLAEQQVRMPHGTIHQQHLRNPVYDANYRHPYPGLQVPQQQVMALSPHAQSAIHRPQAHNILQPHIQSSQTTHISQHGTPSRSQAHLPTPTGHSAVGNSPRPPHSIYTQHTVQPQIAVAPRSVQETTKTAQPQPSLTSSNVTSQSSVTTTKPTTHPQYATHTGINPASLPYNLPLHLQLGPLPFPNMLPFPQTAGQLPRHIPLPQGLSYLPQYQTAASALPPGIQSLPIHPSALSTNIKEPPKTQASLTPQHPKSEKPHPMQNPQRQHQYDYEELVSEHFKASLKNMSENTKPVAPQPVISTSAPAPGVFPQHHDPSKQQATAHQNPYKSPSQPSYIVPQAYNPPTTGHPYFPQQWATQHNIPNPQPGVHHPPNPEAQSKIPVAKPQPTPEPIKSIPLQKDAAKTNDSDTSGVMGLFQRYPVIWQGKLMLKSDAATVQTHYICGNRQLGEGVLPGAQSTSEGNLATLKINQRMRLEPSQLEDVSLRLNGSTADFCLLLALPCGSNQTDVTTQQNLLRQSFVEYLQLKQAAGIVNINAQTEQGQSYVVQIFPPCEFTAQNLQLRAQDFLSNINDIPHLMIVIAPC